MEEAAGGHRASRRLTPRVILALVLLVTVLTAGTLALALRGGDSRGDYLGSVPPVKVTLPDFSLRDYTGDTVSAGDLHGRVVLVTFLDTRCRESCPIIASLLGRTLDRLSPAERKSVAVVAFTVDPVDDTPQAVRDFLRAHRVEGRIRYLIGSEQELRPLWTAFAVLPAVDSGSDDIHSAPVRIFDRDGVWVSTQHVGVDLTPDNLAHDVREALG